MYVSEKGSDENGDGSEAKPFKSVLQAMRSVGTEPFPVIYVDNKDSSDKVMDRLCYQWLTGAHVAMGWSVAESNKEEQEDLGERTTH